MRDGKYLNILDDSITINEDLLLKDDPDFVKYFNMLKMGIPIGAVKNAVVRDRKDPNIIDLDPNKSVKSQLKKDED